MKIELLTGLILTILPITELRVGLPIILNYVIKNDLPVTPYFLLVLALNILIIFFIFFFLDFIHQHLLKIHFYKNLVEKKLNSLQEKSTKLQQRFNTTGFFALTLFVAIPLPGTGAWTGTILAWILNLERKKSIIAIATGVIIAGILILLASLGILNIIY